MSIYWTEEEIITEKKTYLKRAFKGKYHAERLDERSQYHSEYFNMSVYEGEAVIGEVRKYPGADFPEASGARSFTDALKEPLICYDPTTDSYFKLRILEPRISKAKLSNVVSEGDERYGTISGVLYGYVAEITREPVKTVHEKPDVQITVYPYTETESRAGWTRTSVHEFSFSGFRKMRRDHYRHTDGTGTFTLWSGIRTFFSFGILALLLLFLLSLGWPGFVILGFIFLVFFSPVFSGQGLAALFIYCSCCFT